MQLLATLCIGLIVGAIAKLITPGKDPGGWILTILLGIGGALVGTWLGQALGLYAAGERAGFIGSVCGAVLILLGYRMVRRRSAS